jgi:hypothetical protein
MENLSGIDFCATPAAQPPKGMVSNFEDRGKLVPAVIGVCTIMMALALLATAGRVFANRKRLAWSDCELSHRCLVVTKQRDIR